MSDVLFFVNERGDDLDICIWIIISMCLLLYYFIFMKVLFYNMFLVYVWYLVIICMDNWY